jgi:hypothetical protein
MKKFTAIERITVESKKAFHPSYVTSHIALLNSLDINGLLILDSKLR